MRPVLVLDSETVVDVAMARKVVGRSDLEDQEVLAQVAPPRAEGEEHGFPKPLYHRVVEVSVCVVTGEGKVETLRPLGPSADEQSILRDFWAGFGHHAGSARIVTYNGRKFDMPVLAQRALASGVSPSPFYTGDYRQRFRDSHLDLMEVISDYGSSLAPSQHEMATMLGVPGKMGVDGGDVKTLWAEGKVGDIAAYCTCDVATLTLCFARLGVHTGWCKAGEAEEIERGVHSALEALTGTHALYGAFLEALG